MQVPDYRVRLFLSVDLTGSTAYKHKNKNSLEWIKAFQAFYGRFPQLLSEFYTDLGSERGSLQGEELDAGRPKLWKTVGDEILFCCRLTSLCQLGLCIDSFVEALKSFGSTAKAYGLNTKGNAWVASFPTPNCCIRPVVRRTGIGDALNGSADIPSEENERLVDEDPSDFDFLGKGIDAGFRISRNSAIDALTISPGLGILLAQATGSHRVTGFKRQIRLAEMQQFKGVANDSPYPVLTIDTSRDSAHEALIERQRRLLGIAEAPQPDEIEHYLTQYLNYHGIEVPKVKSVLGESFSPPQFYEDFKRSWEQLRDGLASQDRHIQEATDVKETEEPLMETDQSPLDGVLDIITQSLTPAE